MSVDDDGEGGSIHDEKLFIFLLCKYFVYLCLSGIPVDEALKDDSREHLNIVFVGHVDAGDGLTGLID